MVAGFAAVLGKQARHTVLFEAAQQTKHLAPLQPNQRTGVTHTQTTRLNPQQHLKPAELLLAHRQHRHGAPPGTPEPAGVSPLLCRGVSSLYCAYNIKTRNWSSGGVDGPRRHQACQNEVAVDLRQRRPSVEQISRIGMDTSKHIFQLHGVNTAERPVLRKKLRRREMFAFLEQLAPTVIAIEACGASHHCARLLQSFGHSVKLIAPQLVKPYLKRGKNDAADAEALCEAMSRPTMRFVPVKTAEQQAALMLVGVRDRLIRNRTQLSNAIRGYAGEFGLTAAKGRAHLASLLERIQADESLPALARELFAAQAEEYAQLQA